MQDFYLFFYLLLIFVIFCKNNRSNGSEIRHKKCFFCTFSFLRPFKADTIHLCFVLRTSGWSFVVHCAGCHPAFFFVFRRILSAAFYSIFLAFYSIFLAFYSTFLAFYSIFLAFYSIFLHFFFKIHANFPFFLAHSIFLYYFCTLIRFRLFPTVTRRSPDSHPTVDRRLNDDEVSVNRQ